MVAEENAPGEPVAGAGLPKDLGLPTWRGYCAWQPGLGPCGFHGWIAMDLESDVCLMKGCRWVSLPPDQTGTGSDFAMAQALGFEAPRLFWLTSIAKGQWRGRHAHRSRFWRLFA